MELKDYRVQPDEGLFENISRRLRVRRMMRVGGVAAAVVCVTAVGVWALTGTAGEGETLPTAAPLVAQSAEVVPVAMPEETVAAPVRGEVVAKKEVPAAEEAEAPVAVAEREEAIVAPASVPAKVVPAVENENTPQVVAPKPVATTETVATEQPAVVAETETPEEPIATPSGTKNENPSTPAIQYDNIVWAPTVIVPSGDVDENRTFSVKLSSAVSEFRVTIYNRAGSLVFSSSDPNFVWDATARGVQVPQGAYVWVAKFRDSDNRPRQEKGTVTVIR